jgi:hypothetical protein
MVRQACAFAFFATAHRHHGLPAIAFGDGWERAYLKALVLSLSKFRKNLIAVAGARNVCF